MKAFLIALLVALVLVLPAASTDNVRSPNIYGTIPVTIHASGLTPGGVYTPEWKVYQSDTDTHPSRYFRSAETADANGNIVTSVPLQVLSEYNGTVPYVVEMLLTQPDANGFLQPVYDANGHEYCTRVDVWEWGTPSQDNCNA